MILNYPNMKKKWRAYTILNSKWLPTATDKKRLKDLEKDLEGVVVNEEK